MHIMIVWFLNLLIDWFTDLSFYQLIGLRVYLSDYRLVDRFCD